ncbi:MAG: MarR family transcriptional regulator [Thermoleophilia bacterium]|nr:MarR family transcriptional regulator [Thermoleophilia bacterium]
MFPVRIAADPVAVANRLRPVLLRLNRELRRELAALGMTGGQATLLHLIHRSPGVGVRDLAVREGMSAAGMSGHVDRLEAAGLVRRVPSTDDRRRVGLEVTSEGARALRAVRRTRTAWLARRLDRLEPAELEAVDAAIEPLLRLVEEDA